MAINISHFIVLGLLDQFGSLSGYDIIKLAEHRAIHKWTGFKPGSIYHSLSKLEKDERIEPVESMKDGQRPEKTMYKITVLGQRLFDDMQEEAFKGLYPHFFGFNMALALNSRRTPEEIRQKTKWAIVYIEELLQCMEDFHKNPHHPVFKLRRKKTKNLEKLEQRKKLHVLQQRLHYEAEKKWLEEVANHAELFTEEGIK